MVEMRYRDSYVLPFGLMILWATSFGIIAQRYLKPLAAPVLLVAALFFAVPAYAADYHASDILRSGDRRVDASHWLENHVHIASGMVKEHTIGDFLPQVSGYPAGFLRWNVVHSMLEKSASEWWNAGYVYSVADDGYKDNGWFEQGTDRSLYNDFTLAYQTPDQMQGPGPRIAIFYNFKIKSPVNLHLADLAEVFGYNVDQRNICTGQQFGMRVFIRALRTTDVFYQTEIVLRDAVTGKAVVTDRQTPVLGQRPSTIWEKYELLFDDHWLQVPANLEAGTYRLEMALYEPYHGNRVGVLDSGNAPQGDSVPLGNIEVLNNCTAPF